MTFQIPLPAMWLSTIALIALPVVAADPPAPPSAPPSPAAVVNMINNCYSCHGTDGRSPGSIPSLTNMNEKQALLVLKELKSGTRASTVMSRHAKGYTDAELEALAKYIANNLK